VSAPAVKPDVGDAVRPEHLEPTAYIDSAHPAVLEFASRAVGDADDPHERISRLFGAVRDGIRYDPYTATDDPGDYVASNVIGRTGAYCIPKSVVLVAGARSIGIPARLGFADVRNHLTSDRLRELMGGSDVFAYHGYAELNVDGHWRKATSAFNSSLCARFGVPPLEFDGIEDAMLHPFTGEGDRYMEYVRERGSFTDLPLDEIVEEVTRMYPALMRREREPVADPKFDGPAEVSVASHKFVGSRAAPGGASRRPRPLA
jgi:transglutaminase-like putative cysteine protease